VGENKCLREIILEHLVIRVLGTLATSNGWKYLQTPQISSGLNHQWHVFAVTVTAIPQISITAGAAV
jgi:hypothetical protein